MNHQFYPAKRGKALRNYVYVGSCGSMEVEPQRTSGG